MLRPFTYTFVVCFFFFGFLFLILYKYRKDNKHQSYTIVLHDIKENYVATNSIQNSTAARIGIQNGTRAATNPTKVSNIHTLTAVITSRFSCATRVLVCVLPLRFCHFLYAHTLSSALQLQTSYQWHQASEFCAS